MSVRRNARLRKEYLYRRSLKGKESELYEKKRKLREALREGKQIPTELLGIIPTLNEQLEMEDTSTFQLPSTIDDEYALSGVEDPKIMITTSHEPSAKLTQFAKEMKLIFPDAQRMNRGNHVKKELVDSCRRNGVTDLIIFHETRGRPDGMVISHMPSGPTAYFVLSNVVARHDIKEGVDTMSTTAPHLIFHNFNSNLGKRTVNILKHLFPVPKDEGQRVMTFSNDNDFISFRHHVWVKKGHNDVELEEIGPRFELRLFKITLGTFEMTQADNEYTLRNFTNTGKKRTVL